MMDQKWLDISPIFTPCGIYRSNQDKNGAQWTTGYILRIYAHNLRSVVRFSGFCADQFTHIVQDYSTGTGEILWLPRYQWSNPQWIIWADR